MCCGLINVKDYPYCAVGNGSHDDTAAFQAAIAAAVVTYSDTQDIRTSICIPAGHYIICRTLTIPYGLSLMGQPGGTVLDFSGLGDGDTEAIQWGTYDPDFTQGVLSGLTMYGPGPTTSTIGVMVGDTSSSGPAQVAGCELRDCFIREFGTAIRLGTNCFVNKFENLRITDNGVGLDTPNSPANFGEQLLFSFCNFDGNAKHFSVHPGIGGQWFTFRNCSFTNATSAPESTIGAGYSVLFDKCCWYSDITGSSGDPLLMEIVWNLGSVVFQDSYFSLGSPSGVPICWNTLYDATPTPVKFDCCVVSGLGEESPYFWGATSSCTSAQPTALAIQSPSVTADSGKITRIGP